MSGGIAFSTETLDAINAYREIAAKEAHIKASNYAITLVKAFTNFSKLGMYKGSKLYLSNVVVKQLCLAMFEDLLRLQAYHPITIPTRYKYAAFTFKWINKCRPIKSVADNYNAVSTQQEYEDITKVNACFALHFVCAFLDGCEIENIPNAVLKELLYTGTFRSIHPEQLALTFEQIAKLYGKNA